MKVIGLTGGVACGKSEAAKYLKTLNFPVIDCDKINKCLQLTQKEVIKKIIKAFPQTALSNQEIDRNKLSHEAFSNPENLKKIGQIMMPYILKEIEKLIKKYKSENYKFVFIEAPLLFETGLDKICQQTVCIWATFCIQRQRFLERAGMNEEIFNLVLATQMPIEEKKERADTIILSDNLQQLHLQLDELLKKLNQKKPKIGFFAGSFDPFTKGHLYLICKALSLCDKVYVGVGINPFKKHLFSIEERLRIVTESIQDFMHEPIEENNVSFPSTLVKAHQKLLQNPSIVQVVSYKGLTVDAAIQANATILFRGARNTVDRLFEEQLDTLNKSLLEVRQTKMENIILTPPQNLTYVSSTAVKNLCDFQEFIAAKQFVYPSVYTELLKKYLFQSFQQMAARFHVNEQDVSIEYQKLLYQTSPQNIKQIAEQLNYLHVNTLQNNEQLNSDEEKNIIAAIFYQNHEEKNTSPSNPFLTDAVKTLIQDIKKNNLPVIQSKQ